MTAPPTMYARVAPSPSLRNMVTNTSAVPSISARSVRKRWRTSRVRRSPLGILDRRKQGAERQQHGAVAGACAIAPGQAPPGPASPRDRRASRRARRRMPKAPWLTSLPDRAERVRAHQRGDWPGRKRRPRPAAPSSSDAALFIEVHLDDHRAAAGRGPHFGAPLRDHREGRDAGWRRRAAGFRRCRAAGSRRRQVVPWAPSSSRMPSAVSSSRMRSASAKSRRALASARAAMRPSTSLVPLAAEPLARLARPSKPISWPLAAQGGRVVDRRQAR